MRLVLIGFMGSGKSTVARLLAQRCSLSAVDLDQAVCETFDFANVAEIFESKGESFFRSAERDVALSLQSQQSVVIASGGGVVEHPETMSALLTAETLSFFLYTPYQEIVSRLQSPAAQKQRPLFSTSDDFAARFARRDPLYRRYANYVIKTDGRSPEEVCEAIAALCTHDQA